MTLRYYSVLHSATVLPTARPRRTYVPARVSE
jgi:hypothetical protein